MQRPFWLAAVCLFGCSSNAQTAVPFDDGKSADTTPVETTPRLAYPAAPYGVTSGAIMQNLDFLGWTAPQAVKYDSTKIAPLSLADYYDPTGAKKTPLLVITSTALWCSACKLEYTDMKTQVAAYQAKGVAFLGALFEDNDGNPAQPPDLTTWAKQFSVAFPFVLDPSLKLGSYFDVNGTPMEMIVDTRNMQIIVVEEGWAQSGSSSLWAQLDQLLAQ
jgi:hypothetical protein